MRGFISLWNTVKEKRTTAHPHRYSVAQAHSDTGHPGDTTHGYFLFGIKRMTLIWQQKGGSRAHNLHTCALARWYVRPRHQIATGPSCARAPARAGTHSRSAQRTSGCCDGGKGHCMWASRDPFPQPSRSGFRNAGQRGKVHKSYLLCTRSKSKWTFANPTYPTSHRLASCRLWKK